MTEELKPCPFCGYKIIRILPRTGGCWCADCLCCSAEVRAVSRFKEDVITLWNRRNDPKAVSLLPEEQKLYDFTKRNNENV